VATKTKGLAFWLQASIAHLHFGVYIKFIMRYSYDPKKKATNLKKHGLDFDDARSVIESGQTVTFEDRRFDYDEVRYITLGLLQGEVVVIATAETETTIRIISMRKADKNEQKIYYENC
jgi:uncharacterized DUF497 family protein